MALVDGVTGNAVTRILTCTRLSDTNTRGATVDWGGGTQPIERATCIHSAGIPVIADDGGTLTARRRIAAIGRTEITVVAIDCGFIYAAGLGLRVHSINGAGIPVIAERFGVHEATPGEIAVGQVRVQGILANSDGMVVLRIIRGKVTNLELGARYGRRRPDARCGHRRSIHRIAASTTVSRPSATSSRVSHTSSSTGAPVWAR